MSNSTTLVDLLAAKERLFALALRQLEEATGKKSVDVRLMGEIIEKAHDRMRKLGLDDKDTTGKELYHALLNQARVHDEHLAKALGAQAPDLIEEMVPLVVNVIQQLKIPTDCWVLKHSVARDMLRAMPPKKIMKLLGYRSVDSMLKSEKLSEIYGALRFAESGEWLNRFNAQYKKLRPSDFETRKIELVVMPKERWGGIASHFVEKKRHLNTHLKELGVVMILPATSRTMPGITTKLLSLTLHYINEIRLYSAFFKLKAPLANFGEVFVDTLIADPGNAATIAGTKVHWRVIQRYFGKLEKEHHPEIFEPHVQPEDLHWRKAEEVMYDIDPELEFWQEMDYVGLMYGNRPVTFNLMDVSLSYSNSASYEDRYIYHFREALWNEVFIRYLGQKTLEDQVLKQLDNEMIAPEKIAARRKR